MRKCLISVFILIVYSALLVKVMVFKDLPTIRIGQLMLNFAGTDVGQAPNFVPFKTIVPYLLGYKGLIIAGVNLVGNVVLLVPVGFLAPLIFPNMTWKKALALAVTAGLVIEVMQVALRVGIFDIDDVILNALGVMIGYGAFVVLSAWIHSRNYKNIIIAAIIAVAAASAFYGFVVYPMTHQTVNPRAGVGDARSERFDAEEDRILQSGQTGDLCGGTGGIGQIVSIGDNNFALTRNDGVIQTINLTDQATIETLAGPVSVSDLKAGDRVTLVGDQNPNGSFTANTVVVCTTLSSENQSGQ